MSGPETLHVRSKDLTRIAVHREGSGPPLLLIHGALVDHECWARVIPLLTDRFTVFNLARRGRGGSGDSLRYAPEREVEDVAAALEEIGPCDVLAHSSGATLALLAAEAKLPLRRMVLYDPPYVVEGSRLPPSVPVAQRLEALLATGDRDEVVEAFLGGGPALTTDEIAEQRAGPRWQQLVDLAHTTPYDIRLVAHLGFDRKRLGAIDRPTLLLLGELSVPWLQTGVRALDAILPDSRLQELPGQRHLAIFTAPQLVANATIEFLGGDPG